MENRFKSLQIFSACWYLKPYIQPTQYRQIIKTQSAKFLLPKEQKWISEDQKHSSNLAHVNYQRKRSREVAMRACQCMEKLGVESKNLHDQHENIQRSSAGQDDVPEAAASYAPLR